MRHELPRTTMGLAVVAAVVAVGTMPAAAEPMELPRLSRDAEAANRTGSGWDGKAGVDPHLTNAPTVLVPGATLTNDGTGTAWASINLPGSDLVWQKASIDARVDPAQQAQVGVTFKKPIVSAGGVSLTLENSYSLTRHIETPSPVPQIQPTEQAAQNWGAASAVRLDVNKTSLSVGAALSSADNQWHSKVALEREIFKGLSVTSEVTSVGTSGTGASAGVGAKYKLQW